VRSAVRVVKKACDPAFFVVRSGLLQQLPEIRVRHVPGCRAFVHQLEKRGRGGVSVGGERAVALPLRKSSNAIGQALRALVEEGTVALLTRGHIQAGVADHLSGGHPGGPQNVGGRRQACAFRLFRGCFYDLALTGRPLSFKVDGG
jgi:hypothetical protein